MSTKPESKNENEPADEALTDEQLESVAGGAAFVKFQSTSGDADMHMEEISFTYQKVMIEY